MKKGPLSKTEKSYISKNHENMTATIMADKMNRSVHMVDKYIDQLEYEPIHAKRVVQADPAKPASDFSEAQKQDPAPTVDSSSLYVRDKNKVATIMTEAASAAGDESRKRSQMPQRYKGMIHKIKED